MRDDAALRVVFFGTPQFAAKTLQYLIDHHVEVVAVVTKPDKAQGRSSTPVPTPVKAVALSQNPPLPVFQPEIVSIKEFAPILEQFQADLFVVVAYGEILKQHLLDIPKKGCINLHASLLPIYRGAAPIQRAIINGETESGVTIIHMVKKMDAGDMIGIEKVAIPQEMTYGELETKLCDVGSESLLKTIHEFINGEPKRVVQDETLVSFAPKIELENCEIKWNQPSLTIHNLVRGVNPHPGAWCFADVKGQRKRIRILSTKVIDDATKELPGSIFLIQKDHLMVACANGSILEILEIQPEGKKPMAVKEFLRGSPIGSFSFQN